MHEFSLASEIIELIESSAKENNATKVLHYHLEVGMASGVLIPALQFALEDLSRGSLLDSASCEITSVKPEFRCVNCDSSFQDLSLDTLCPVCGQFLELTRGKELIIKSFEMDQS